MYDRMFYTYIVASHTRVVYTGVTGDLHQRVFEHRTRRYSGFTARYGCDRLVWCEPHPQILAAIRREKEIKGWTRSKKITLIESLNPDWEDLSRGWDIKIEPATIIRADPSLRSG